MDKTLCHVNLREYGIDWFEVVRVPISGVVFEFSSMWRWKIEVRGVGALLVAKSATRRERSRRGSRALYPLGPAKSLWKFLRQKLLTFLMYSDFNEQHQGRNNCCPPPPCSHCPSTTTFLLHRILDECKFPRSSWTVTFPICVRFSFFGNNTYWKTRYRSIELPNRLKSKLAKKMVYFEKIFHHLSQMETKIWVIVIETF